MENDLAAAEGYQTGFVEGWDHGLRLKAQHKLPIEDPYYCATCGEMHSGSTFPLVLDSWFDRADTTTEEGRVFIDTIREASGGPDDRPYLKRSGGEGVTRNVLVITDLNEATRIRITCLARALSMGGTNFYAVVESGTVMIKDDSDSSNWVACDVTVTIGSDGILILRVDWEPGWLDLLLEDIGPA